MNIDKKDVIEYQQQYMKIQSGLAKSILMQKHEIILYVLEDISHKEALYKFRDICTYSIFLVLYSIDYEFFIKNKVKWISISGQDKEQDIIQKETNPQQIINIGHRRYYRCILSNSRGDHPSILPIYYMIHKKYFLINIYTMPKNEIRLVFSDKKKIGKEKIIFFAGGIGDNFILIPILYYAQNHGTKLPIILTYSYDVIKYLTNSMNQLYFIKPNVEYENIMMIIKADFFDTIKLDINNKESIFEETCKYFKANGYIDTSDPVEILNDFKKNFPHHWYKSKSDKSSTYKVAFQRMSTSINIYGKYAKVWPKSECRKFIKQCAENNIKIINIAWDNEMENEYPENIGHQTFEEVLEKLKDVDAFIGIDSSFGHACALLGTPNITLFVSDDIKYQYYSFRFMPISMNYSVFTENGYITAEKAFDVLWRVLHFKINLKEHYISLDQKVEKRHYEIINGGDNSEYMYTPPD